MDDAPRPLPAEAAPAWRDILLRAVAAEQRGKAAVARRLGVSRCYVSRALSEGSSAYAAVPASFVRRVIDTLHVVRECPVTCQPRPVADCRRINAGPAPTHNPLAMLTWRACQACPCKPAPEVKP